MESIAGTVSPNSIEAPRALQASGTETGEGGDDGCHADARTTYPTEGTVMSTTISSATATSDPPARPAHWRTSTEVAHYVDAMLDEGERFANAAEAGPLAASIDACPGWTMRELVEHVGLVHLWAAANIAFPSSSWITVDGFDDLRPYWPELCSAVPADSELVEWYRSTLRHLADVIESTPADHRCLTFLPASSPIIMWARRQAFEVAVHRYDAEAARGVTSWFDPSLAADLLDELLAGFAPRMRSSAADRDRVIRIELDDAPSSYTITMSRFGVSTTAGTPEADAHLLIRGSAADVALLLWNRPAGPTVRYDGDERVLDVWAETCRIEWR